MADRRSPVRRVLSRGLGLAIDAGLVPYRPILRSGATTWDRDYAAGELEYYRRLIETARYGVLIGYLTGLGGPFRLLDVGCGVGILRERLDAVPFAEYVGIDVSSVAVEAARNRLTDPLTRFVQGDSPRGLGPFDVAVCNEMLYVVDEPARLLDEIAGELRTDGYLLVSMMRHRGERALWRMVERRFERLDAVECRNLTSGAYARLACYRRKP